MQRRPYPHLLWTVSSLLMISLCPTTAASEELEELVVTSERRPQQKLVHPGNIAVLGTESIMSMQHRHIGELLHQVPGIWIVRGSGQDHQAAIRSPVLGGGGACGGFLILEDGVPTRPASFCNINQLIELHAEQARSIEVVRGPATAFHGSNALHGIVNVVMPVPGDNIGAAGIEIGSGNFVRLRASLPFEDADWLAGATLGRDGGHREMSGYEQAKLHAGRRWKTEDGEFRFTITTTSLRQESAGFIGGLDAYKDRSLSRSNPTPGAFRHADATRITGRWTGTWKEAEFDVRPFLRRSRMTFTHHSIPGQPVERNGQTSAGVLATLTFSSRGSLLATGLDLEWSDAFLNQVQEQAATGRPRQVAIRPVGAHYDYAVQSSSAALFLQGSFEVGDAVSLHAGVRAEYAHHNYRNRMLTGNTRDDGSPCDFGGCLYTRPASRSNHYTTLVPNFSAVWRLRDNASVYATLARGSRIPQSLELYRLQNGQDLADLKPETGDSAEFGYRNNSESWNADIAIFAMRKRNGTFRDSDGFNVSGARSRHSGIEMDLSFLALANLQIDVNASYAQHTYDFDSTSGSQLIVSGNDIATAPRWLGSLGANLEASKLLTLGLQWQFVGSYYLDPENRFRYDGHAIANFRAIFRRHPKFEIAFRVGNVFDRRFADRAVFANGDYRYLPGRAREYFIELRTSR